MVGVAGYHFHPKLFHIVLLLAALATFVYIFMVNTYIGKTGEKTILRPEGLKIQGKNFSFNRKPFRIMSGSLHYFRVPASEWDDRLLKMKAMGLNTIDIYIPWNLHEPSPGNFDFEGQLNIRTFLNLVETYKLLAIIRPGPYICSEWDLGGLPSWLLRDRNMKLRSMYKPFMHAVNSYFAALLPILKSFQFSHGGPVIAFQIENEYGVYDNDVEYMKTLKELFEHYELEELFFVCDNEEGLGKVKLDGVLQTINFMSKNAKKMIEMLEQLQPNSPVFVTEFWDGWFDHWGEKHHTVNVNELRSTLEYIMKKGGSFNLYMWHGGTNFGFMNGANANDDGTKYQSDVTSYDYDAPVSETGVVRDKYRALKDTIVINSHQALEDLPWFTEHQGFTAYGDIEFREYIRLEDMIKKPILSAITRKDVVTMEMLPINDNAGQSYGYIVYKTEVKQTGKELVITNARDFVVVILNGHIIFTSTHHIKKSIEIDVNGHFKTGTSNVLIILVENCGRVNYGKDINNQRKGILGGVRLDEKALNVWSIYPLEFRSEFIQRLAEQFKSWKTFIEKKSEEPQTPTLYKGNMFVHSYPRDTILSLPGWFKGVVFINGYNLGRYWDIGPQKTLFIPSRWLKMSNNTVILFDLHGNPSKHGHSKYPSIVSVSEHDIGQNDAVPFLI